MQVLGFCGFATFPGWHEEVDARTGSLVDIKPFPSPHISRVCARALDFGALMMLVSALWQHVAASSAASMVSAATQGRVTSHVGPISVTLVWLSFAMAVIPAIGVEVMITSIALLDALTDD